MKNYNELFEADITKVKPKGWIYNFLKGQASGIVGNLDEIGYPFNTFCWENRHMLGSGIENWWPYEQTAYWTDAMIRTAVLLEDNKLLEKAFKTIDKSLPIDGNPFYGPLELKEGNTRHRWPHAVYFRALWIAYETTKDEKYLNAMYKHYLDDFDFDYFSDRNSVNLETILKLAEHFNDESLLEFAKEQFEKYNQFNKLHSVENMLKGDDFCAHGVTITELLKVPIIMYSYTGIEEYLKAAKKRFQVLDEKYMLPDGIIVSQEFNFGNASYMAHESCDITDYTWTAGYLLEASGDGEYADKIEKAIFNALPGAVLPEFRGIQYFSSPNQVICTRNSAHLKGWCNTTRMAFQPHQYPECCVGNIGRAMPNYVVRMYQNTKDGLAVSLYGDSVFYGENIEIIQEGNYPFGDSVTFKVKVKNPHKNTLRLRIPAWSKNYSISVNGEEIRTEINKGFISYKVHDKDVICLKFEKSFISHKTADNGVYFTYGPFTLSLKIQEKTEIDKLEKRQTKDFPAFNITPQSAWNFAVTGKEKPQIIKHEISENPFWNGIPFEIKISAKVLNNWNLVTATQKEYLGDEKYLSDKNDIACGATIHNDDVTVTPMLPDDKFIHSNLGETKIISLIPYGCTNIRLTVFPKYN